jgi:hypothetical protein
MADETSATESLKPERAIASKLWPHHAEICSEADWVVISLAVQEDRPISESVVDPVGESKDHILVSFTVLYWGMKLAVLALRIANEVSRLPKPQRKKALLEAITKRMDSNTPKVVADKIEKMVDDIESE